MFAALTMEMAKMWPGSSFGQVERARMPAAAA
jgi:hypothetical protein